MTGAPYLRTPRRDGLSLRGKHVLKHFIPRDIRFKGIAGVQNGRTGHRIITDRCADSPPDLHHIIGRYL